MEEIADDLMAVEVTERDGRGISAADAGAIKRTILKLVEESAPTGKEIVDLTTGIVEAFQILDDEAFIQHELEMQELKKHEQLTASAK